MLTIFFAYSHRDEEVRNELEIHLAMLKRQGIITTWHDRRIDAGEEINGRINRYLEEANIFLLLVSPYFLASDYCYDIEMNRAMERHETGSARVIPIILDPCDWKKAPFGKLKAVPKDGRPISKFPNKHDALLEVVQAIRNAAEKFTSNSDLYIPSKKTIDHKGPPIVQDREQVDIRTRSSNLRIKKKFSDRDNDLFLSQTFEYIANFFEASLSELKERNPGTELEFRRIDANHFKAKIYLEGEAAGRCRIWMGGGSGFTDGIFYSQGDSDRHSGYNESLSVENDGYSLFLKSLGLASMGKRRPEQMTQQGGSEYLWSLFIEPLQR